jgi:hypothetical protein
MPVAPKLPPLMAETSTTANSHLLAFCLSSAHMPRTPQPTLHFGFQGFFQTATHHLSDLGCQYSVQFWSESWIVVLWHLQDKASDGYNRHDLISCRLCGGNHILQDDQVLARFP